MVLSHHVLSPASGVRENDMYLKPKKCEFAKERMEYLGMIISHNSVSMDLVKLAVIQNWPTPTTVKQVQLFLGFGNYYWWFIKKFAHLAQPLNNLLKKDAKFKWTNIIWNPKKEVQWGTCSDDARLDKILSDQNRCFQICLRGSPKTNQYEWWTPLHTYQKHSLKQKGIMMPMTGNYWLSSEPWLNGDITYRGPITQQQYIWITRTWCTFKVLRT